MKTVSGARGRAGAIRRDGLSVRDRTIKFHAKNILGTGARALLEDVREGIIRKSAPFKSA